MLINAVNSHMYITWDSWLLALQISIWYLSVVNIECNSWLHAVEIGLGKYGKKVFFEGRLRDTSNLPSPSNLPPEWWFGLGVSVPNPLPNLHTISCPNRVAMLHVQVSTAGGASKKKKKACSSWARLCDKLWVRGDIYLLLAYHEGWC